MSSEAFQRGDAPLAHPSVSTEPSGRRDWGAIGFGLAGAFALIGIFCAGIWAIVVLVQALV
jgi:hypothetical protein